MNSAVQITPPAVTTETPAVSPVAKPARARKAKPAVSAQAEIAKLDAQAVANMAAELIALRAKVDAQGNGMEKREASDEEIAQAVSKLEAAGKSDLASANPKASPVLSLASVLGFIPKLTKEQRKVWEPVRDSLRKSYSDLHRGLLAKRKAIFNRVSRKPDSLVSTVARARKDGTHARVSLSVSEPAKPRRRKADAKPAQVAAKVPAAGNAHPPAAVQ